MQCYEDDEIITKNVMVCFSLFQELRFQTPYDMTLLRQFALKTKTKLFPV